MNGCDHPECQGSILKGFDNLQDSVADVKKEVRDNHSRIHDYLKDVIVELKQIVILNTEYKNLDKRLDGFIVETKQKDTIIFERLRQLDKSGLSRGELYLIIAASISLVGIVVTLVKLFGNKISGQ